MEFSMGASNSASESISLTASPESTVSSSTQLGAGVAATSMSVSGSGAYNFDQNFSSISGDENVRLVAKMSDSAAYRHSYLIEARETDRIRVSQSLGVTGGQRVEAWNEASSGALVARAGVKVLSGSLNYTGYGDASAAKVVAGQAASIPANTPTSVFAEARNVIGSRISTMTIKSSTPKTATTTATATPTSRSILNSVR